MKNLVTVIIMVISSLLSFGQNTIDKDVIFESTKNKDLLYTNAKMFIAENFKSANDVIQLDDKENGVILVKGVVSENIVVAVQSLTYYFSFTMKIMIKDNKYRIIIENIENTISPYYSTLLINNFRGSMKDGIHKSKYEELMLKLSTSIDNIVKTFESSMNKDGVNIDW
jgi:hypothetical protein